MRVIAIILGIGVVMARAIRRMPILACIVVACVVATSTPARNSAHNSGHVMSRAELTEYVQNLVGGQRQNMARLDVLEHACTPKNTGGGVTTCMNPNAYDLAFNACMRNDAYIGVTQEDTRHLFVQCVDDYMRERGWR